SNPKSHDRFYRIEYGLDDEGYPVLGDPVEVVQTYVNAKGDDVDEDAGQKWTEAIDAAMGEYETVKDEVKAEEAADLKAGRRFSSLSMA
ncbi:hypothetical protein M3M33_14805, partial [Loigolactobacillus coryniformis]|uniref:hypothetical protein n=1 Tax=Loigolactobacillus coryniformis TaxID=1610 RepID=UPI00201B243B